MFDITSSKLLLLAIVALIVIGPKDFPILLRTIGKYVGIIRGHAKEFRAQFDEMARESELAQLKQDMEKIGKETEASISATGRSVEKSLDDARQGVETALGPDPLRDPLSTDPFAHNVNHDANGLPPGNPPPAPAAAANGTAPPPGTQPEPRPNPGPQPAAHPPAPEPAPAVAAAPQPADAPERTGA